MELTCRRAFATTYLGHPQVKDPRSFGQAHFPPQVLQGTMPVSVALRAITTSLDAETSARTKKRTAKIIKICFPETCFGWSASVLTTSPFSYSDDYPWTVFPKSPACPKFFVTR